MKATCVPLLGIAVLVSTPLSAAETKAPPIAKATAPPMAGVGSFRPDLTIKAKPNNGVGPLFDFLIENKGTMSTTKESTIQFWAMPPCQRPANIGPGKLLKTGKVKELVVTTSQSYAMSYSFEMPSFYRGCGLKVIVDADKELLEVSEDNNEVILQTKLPPAPDIVVNFTQGYQGPTLIRVKNQGDATAGASVVRMYCSNPPGTGWPCDPVNKIANKTWNWDVPSLPAGQEHVINSPVGFHHKQYVRIQADATLQVGEWFENNNMWPPIPH